MIKYGHIVKSFDKDLQGVGALLQDMGKIVLESMDVVKNFLKSKQNPKKEDIEKVKNRDADINILDSKTEQKITQILALRQPVAFDLRYIISSIRISSYIERMGDQLKHAIRRMEEIDFNNENIARIILMIDKLEKMLNDVFKILVEFHIENIEDLDIFAKLDDEIDEIYYDIVHSVGDDNALKAPSIANMIFIAKSFEKIGDYATNISEIIYYIITGKKEI